MDRLIEGENSLKGTMKVPGDKSISHRAIILGSLAQGKSFFKGLSKAADVQTTVDAMRRTGITMDFDREGIFIHGVGIGGFENRRRDGTFEFDCGNSGTTARLLIGLLCGAGIKARLTGDSSLMKRPMGRVTEPLTRIGAQISSRDGLLPVEISGGRLLPYEYVLPIASAQVKSSLILASLFIHGTSVIAEPVETRDHTERMLLLMDGDIKIKNLLQGKSILITGRKELTPLDITIPGDISSAVYLIIAALVTPSSEVIIQDVLLNRTRAHILEVLKRMGGDIEFEITDELPEPMGNVRAKSSALKGITLGGFEIPLIIDEIPALASCAFFAEGDTIVRGARELRVKESDRIKAIVHMVKQFGGEIEELEDGFIIHGGNRPRETSVESFDDHRIAMASSIIALNVKGKTFIKNADCVDISFPHFFETLERYLVK